MKTIRHILCIFSLPLLFGCFGKAPLQRYYLLDYVPTPSRIKQNLPPLPYKLRIKDLKVAEAYKRSEIVYRKSAHEMMFYNFHKWAVKPEHLITDMIYKHLRSSNLFKSISKTLLDFDPDYTLTGQVLAIEEYDNEEKWFAHLAINFQLEHNQSKQQIWNKTYDVRKAVAQQEPVYVVRELSFLLETVTDKLIEDLELRLAPPSHPSYPDKTPSADSDAGEKDTHPDE